MATTEHVAVPTIARGQYILREETKHAVTRVMLIVMGLVLRLTILVILVILRATPEDVYHHTGTVMGITTAGTCLMN